MTQESETLRNAIRSDEIQCYCDPGSRYAHSEDGHAGNCLWIAAVRKVYASERADEASRETE